MPYVVRMIKRYRWLLLILGWLLVLTPPLSSVLLLMPIVPGAQDLDVVHIAYPIHTWRWFLIGLGLLCLFLAVPAIWKNGRWYGKTTLIVLLLVATGIHGMVATSMSAEAMFTEPVERQFADARPADDSTVAIIVTINGQTKAYPVDLIAYHHKVIDTCGGTPIMVTYCTMCHTGRVYSPVIDGKVETFRLVGANHYNAMFEDVSTKSWWYQATGECVTGPRAGMTLKDIPFDQKYIGDAYRERGNLLVLQPDKASEKKLGRMSGYARRADTSSTLGDMTRVVGIVIDDSAAAYPLLTTHRQGIITIDTLGGKTVFVDAATEQHVRAWIVPDSISVTECIRDTEGKGLAIGRTRSGLPVHIDGGTGTIVVRMPDPARTYSVGKVERIQPWIDYWHSWSHFYPKTRMVIGS